ncbi:MarR family winged helix-turn-helix transcriptional regulator [Aquabacterium humicola]|uniref:MarR family winged helix-turn-helix transcriptional regulator n=1 Tax=Aquabacterium humicola TaxID=3237377 RepID=UPI002542874B|nr:MarR family winged helix-turn-helix transcriptional regulator [Rubrivivax pictus]
MSRSASVLDDQPRPGAPDGDAPSLGALSDVLGYHVAQAAVTTVELFERHIGERYGLRKVEFSILMLLQANHAITPKKLGQMLALTPPNLTLLLDRLQERGLLRRERSQVDRRSHNIVLTEAGVELAAETAAAAVPMERELQGRLSAAERALLIELLRKVAGR